MNSSFVIVGIIFVFHFFNLFAKIIVYVLSGLVQFCLWFQIAFALCRDAMVVSLPKKTRLDNVPSILGFHNQSELSISPPFKVSHLHVIFYLNGVLVVKRASSSRT